VPSHYLSPSPKRSLRAYATDYLKEEIFDEGLTRNIPAFSRFGEGVTSLRPTQMARRHQRSPGAVTLAVRDLDREATTNNGLAEKLDELDRAIGRIERPRCSD
jgi:hypothetical protein